MAKLCEHRDNGCDILDVIAIYYSSQNYLPINYIL